MKTILKSMICLVAAAGFMSCENNEAAQPTAAISMEKGVFDINESMEVRFIGQADNVVIYPGDSSHDYEKREDANSGLVVNKGIFTYAYQQPGTYKVVCVATNHSDEGSIVKRDTCSMYVRVVDDVVEIEKLSAPQVLYDEVFAQRVDETTWKMELPRKIKFKTSTPSVSLSQKLKFYIASDSTKVKIDGAEFKSNSKYNLANVLDINVTSHEGRSVDYKLYTLNYATFKTFSVLGATSKITYTEYDYSYYEMNIEVPAGSDLLSVAPVFTTMADNEKAYINGVEQVSGVSKVDFTKPVTYDMVTVHPDNPAITAKSTFVIAVTTK